MLNYRVGLGHDKITPVLSCTISSSAHKEIVKALGQHLKPAGQKALTSAELLLC